MFWRRMLPAIIAALLLLNFLYFVPQPVAWFSGLLRTLPAPTKEWADIIGALAWPTVVAYLITRYRANLRSFLDTLGARFEKDHVKFGPFEITPNSNVIALDPEEPEESTENYDAEDIERIERLFEFIGESAANVHILSVWVNENVDSELDIADFLTLPSYATQRQQAYAALIERKK